MHAAYVSWSDVNHQNHRIQNEILNLNRRKLTNFRLLNAFPPYLYNFSFKESWEDFSFQVFDLRCQKPELW